VIVETPRVASWLDRANRITPGGVHSPVRAFKAMGIPPLAIAEAHGARVTTAEGNTYIDWIGAWGPALLGHDHPAVSKAVAAAVSKGVVFGLASAPEVDLCERIVSRVPGCEMLRLVVTGTEATMTAVRIARAHTGREGIIKFEGGYHGHADMFLVSAGSGAATLGVPDSPGVTKGAARDTWIAKFNNLESVDGCFERAGGRIAAVIVEPVVGNMGCVPPEPGFLAGLRERCNRHGALLILDEVMCGFRVARGGASERYGVTGDLVTLGKVAGGGLPLAALGGRRDLMNMLAPAGPVYQAGTYAAHPLSVAAGIAMFDAIDRIPDLYDRLERTGAVLEAGLMRAVNRAGVAARMQRVGSMWTLFFSKDPVRSWDDAAAVNRKAHAAFFRGMLSRGILLPPSPFESAFVSLAHDEAAVDETVRAAVETFAGMNS
jgi:glutamate-1-semialdehyde 2,1-aminomutase